MQQLSSMKEDVPMKEDLNLNHSLYTCLVGAVLRLDTGILLI